jgi:hypothetical protein
MIPFLKLLDEVVNPPKKPQEKLVEGTKAFGKEIKEAVDKFNPFKNLSKFNPFRKK